MWCYFTVLYDTLLKGNNQLLECWLLLLLLQVLVQSYPGYPNTFGQRGFIGCSDKRNCSDNPNETFLAIYILYNIKSMYEGRAWRPLQFTLYTITHYCVPTLNMYVWHTNRCTLLSRRDCDFNLYPTNVPVREHQFLSGPGLHWRCFTWKF